MKKLFFICLIFLFLTFVKAKENSYSSEIVNTLETFVNCLNNADEDIYSIVDMSNIELVNKINEQINDINVSYDIKSIKLKENNYYRVKILFSARGDKWSTSGFSSWFDIKLIDGTYKVTDTNLFNKVGFKYISRIAFCIAGFIFVVFSIMFIKIMF